MMYDHSTGRWLQNYPEDDWTPGPPWLDWTMVALGLLAFVGLLLAACKGMR